MNLETLQEIVANIDAVADHVEYIINLVKPSVDIAIVADKPQDVSSRFGGHPFVPTNFHWPIHEIGEYRFLGQINFAEISDRPTALPNSGLLSLFYAYDDEGEVFWGDDGYILGFYWPDYQNHIIFNSPTANQPDSKRIKLTGGIDIPRHEDLRNDWPFDDEVLNELSETIDAKDNYLLGYPSFTSLGYDPTPASEWISLLTVHSLDEFDWCWHDGDKLMIFIELDKLVARDFSFLKSDAG
jgi:uncharacterized protein YwqG